MCGIAGTIGWAELATIDAMTDAMSHRGPDDRGTRVWPEARIALGHRRLAIIDLSPSGHQPMLDGSGRYAIVFNGEIYNYHELRNELAAKGHEFRSGSDTEVLLAAYREWGCDCPGHLRGMFAFAIADLKERLLFLCRDRLGIKPLYIMARPGLFCFASEIRAFLAAGLSERRVDRLSVWHFLSLGSIPHPRTVLDDVRSLCPGHAMLVAADGTVTRMWRYWDLAGATADQREHLSRLSFPEAAVSLREHLEEATRYHLVADVPVGAFLSGGIDSAAMVGLMGRQTTSPIQTFTLGFDSDHGDFSETAAALESARYFGTVHREVHVSDAEVADAFDGLLQALDQPSMDGSNTYFVSRGASAHVKVVLSGLGGDELFAGYPHFRRHHICGFLSPDGVPFFLFQFLRLLPNRYRHNLMLPALTQNERLATLRCLAYDSEKASIVSETFLANLDPESVAEMVRPYLRPGLDPITQLSAYELEGYLVRTLLRDCDAMSMAHSLEVRPILLDHRLVEFAFALPAGHKVSVQEGKRVLSAALSDLLPSSIRCRPKRGFELPLLRWLAGSLRPRALDAFSSAWAQALFSPSFRSFCQSRLSAPGPRDFRLWPYMVLLAWLEESDLTA